MGETVESVSDLNPEGKLELVKWGEICKNRNLSKNFIKKHFENFIKKYKDMDNETK